MQRDGEVIARLGVIGLDGNGLLATGGGLVQAAQFLESISKIAQGVGVIGFYGNRLAIAGGGLVELAQVLKREAKVIVRLGQAGLEGNRLSVTGGGLVQSAQALKRNAQVAMRVGVIGLDCEGLGDKPDGGLVPARLVGGLTQQMQGDGLIGIGLQYLPVDALGFRQAAGGVVPDGEGQGLLDGLRLSPGNRLRLPDRLLRQFLLPAFFSPVHFGALPPRPAPTRKNPKQVPRQL